MMEIVWFIGGLVLGSLVVCYMGRIANKILNNESVIKVLEILKPPRLFSQEKAKSVELIQFKGVDGLELLIPPRLNELNKKRRETKITAGIVLFKGRNLTGYFNLFTKLLFLFEDKPIFLTIKERDLSKFRRKPNVMISIFKPQGIIENQLRMLEYLFMRRVIGEDEYKKRLSELKLKLANIPKYSAPKRNCEYFSSPESIIKDLEVFTSLVKDHGIVMFTMLDEMFSKNPQQARSFFDSATRLCMKNGTPLIFTIEEGTLPDPIVSELKSYCDLILETKVEKMRRIVRVFTQEKWVPAADYEEVLRDYKKFLKDVGFIEER